MDNSWKTKTQVHGDHLNEPPSSPQKKVFQPNISDLFKSRSLPKTISSNIETDPAPCGLANEKEKETAKPCVPSQSIPEDIPVTHTITFGVKPLETMDDEMKKHHYNEQGAPESYKFPSKKYVDKKEKQIPMGVLSASMVSAV